MRLYFAGAFARKVELQVHLREAEAQGHEVTSRWLRSGHQVDLNDEGLSPDGEAKRFAGEDIEDIERADGFVFFSSKDHPSQGQGGRHTEMGIAIWMRELTGEPQIFIIGRRENVFHAGVPDSAMFESFEQLLQFLG